MLQKRPLLVIQNLHRGQSAGSHVGGGFAFFFAPPSIWTCVHQMMQASKMKAVRVLVKILFLDCLDFDLKKKLLKSPSEVVLLHIFRS